MLIDIVVDDDSDFECNGSNDDDDDDNTNDIVYNSYLYHYIELL